VSFENGQEAVSFVDQGPQFPDPLSLILWARSVDQVD
jgi:hypothetical protein